MLEYNMYLGTAHDLSIYLSIYLSFYLSFYLSSMWYYAYFQVVLCVMTASAGTPVVNQPMTTVR